MKDLVAIRPDEIDKDLFYKANVLPLFHGTRTQNISGVIKKGLVIRPSGAVVTGSYFDKEGGLYFADVSCKSINYTSVQGSYYAKGTDKKAFLFIFPCLINPITSKDCVKIFSLEVNEGCGLPQATYILTLFGCFPP